MKKSNKQKKADADFVKKIGSLTFSFGKNPKGLKPGDKVSIQCPGCGEQGEAKFLGAVEVTLPVPVRTQEEQSFSA